MGFDLARTAVIAASRALAEMSEPPAFACVFVRAANPDDVASALAAAQRTIGARHSIGCSSSHGVIGGGRDPELLGEGGDDREDDSEADGHREGNCGEDGDFAGEAPKCGRDPLGRSVQEAHASDPTTKGSPWAGWVADAERWCVAAVSQPPW